MLKYGDIIEFFEEYDVVFGKPRGKGDLGEIFLDEWRVVLDPNQSEESLGVTLLHEILHYFYDDRLGDSIDEVFIEKETQHYVKHRSDIIKFAMSFISLK